MRSATYGIQGRILKVKVVGATKLKNTEWFTKQDPYVILEYGGTQLRTRTCTDGGKTPFFNEKFKIMLIEGLLDMNIFLWNSNTFMPHTFIGSGRVNLQKVLLEGCDDLPWMLKTANSEFAGELNLIMRYSRKAPYSNHMQQKNDVQHPPPHIQGVQGETSTQIIYQCRSHMQQQNDLQQHPPHIPGDQGETSTQITYQCRSHVQQHSSHIPGAQGETTNKTKRTSKRTQQGLTIDNPICLDIDVICLDKD